MPKISDIVLQDPAVKSYDLMIAISATLCAVASLATKTFLTFSGGSDAVYIIAAGYFAIGGNLVLLSPKFIKNPIRNLAGKLIKFMGEKSNFAFILKTLGALGFLIAGIIEEQYGLAIGGGGFFFGNIIALVKGYKIFSIAGYGAAAGAFLSSGLESGNMMLAYAGITAVLETILLAVYKNYDEARFELVKQVWQDKKAELETEEITIEEMQRISRRKYRGVFPEAFMNNIFQSDEEGFAKQFDHDFGSYAEKEKEVIEEAEENEQN